MGFNFHTLDGERYWDERGYYALALDEIERDIEAPTAELEGMCRELVSRAIGDERMMKLLRIPPPYWNWIAASFKRSDPSLYGRFDFRYDGNGPAKLLEYNADTPTAVFETAVFQWKWLEDAKQRRIVPKDADPLYSTPYRKSKGRMALTGSFGDKSWSRNSII
jgi:glutathionylspermidine synthase